MQTRTQLFPISAHGVSRGARRPADCPAFRLPQVSELPLRLEPVGPDTFGGLVGSRSQPARGAMEAIRRP